MSDSTNYTPKKRRTDAEIIAALKATGGMVYLAARQLGCEPKTIYNRRDKSKAVYDAIEQQRGELVDMAEVGLKKAIIEGNVTAMIWVTKTQGKNRGYVERQEHTGAEGRPIAVAAFDYSHAVAAIAAGPDAHSPAPGEDQSRGDGAALGQNADGR